MLSRTLLPTVLTLLASSFVPAVVDAHIAIVYPGSRGNTFPKNGTTEQSAGLAVSTTSNGSEPIFPYGMAMVYPCK